MESILTNSVFSGILGFIIYSTGIWLRKKGEPYQKGIFALHKLAVAGVAVLLILNVIAHFKLISFEGLGEILFFAATIFFIVSFFSGILLGIQKTPHYFIKTIHKICSYVVLLFALVIGMVCH